LSPDDSSRKGSEEDAERIDRREPPPPAAAHEVDGEVRAPTAPTEQSRTISAPNEVEVALAQALACAADAGCFDVVMQLARELEARRSRS
jgi:hypothetical protein